MVYSEATKILAKPLLLAAGIIGIVQALPWTVLSIIAICYYNEAITYETDGSDTASYNFWIYQLFLNPSTTGQLMDVIVTTKAFNIFMYFYMFLSFLWLLISLFITWGMIRNKWNDIYKPTLAWIVLTVCISILDIILMSLIAADLNKFNSEVTVEPAVTTLEQIIAVAEVEKSALLYATIINLTDHLHTIISTSYGIVMSIAARGYLLWVVNVVLAATLIVIALKMHKESRPSLLPYIDAYATGPRPPFEINGNVNDGYQQDDGIFSRGQSLAFPYGKNPGGRLSNNPLANNVALTQSNGSTLPMRQSDETNFSFSKPIDRTDRADTPKVAKIGKAGGGRKSPPQHIYPPNVPPKNLPYIPEPDYSPPGTPRGTKPAKSVLRPKSNYVY